MPAAIAATYCMIVAAWEASMQGSLTFYRGFTFLGYWITKQGVTGVAPSAWEAFRERVARLYEQDAPQEIILRRIGQYVRRWKRWVRSGVVVVFPPYAYAHP
jgi:hypothetical protein